MRIFLCLYIKELNNISCISACFIVFYITIHKQTNMTPLEKSDLKAMSLLRGHTPVSLPVSPPVSVSPKIIQRKVAFDLPFVIMVEDSFGSGIIQNYWRSERKFNQTKIDKAKPFVVDNTLIHNSYNQTPVDTPPPYLMNTKYGIVRITMLKVNPFSIEDALIYTFDTEFDGSTSKVTAFTTVLIEFGEQTYGIKGTDKLIEDLSQEAAIAVNHFLIHYRVLAKRMYIPAVTPQSITRFSVLDLYENNEVGHIIILRHWEKLIPIEKVIPKEIDKKLKHLCISDHSLDTYELLFNETWTRLSLMEWRMAVITNSIMFESWVSTKLREIYKHNDIEEKDIKWKFMTDEPKKDDRKNLGIIEICERLFLDAIGFDFKKTSEFKDVKEKAIILRNSIIHKGRINLTQQEAYAAVHSARSAVSVLTTHMATYLAAKGLPITLHKFDIESK